MHTTQNNNQMNNDQAPISKKVQKMCTFWLTDIADILTMSADLYIIILHDANTKWIVWLGLIVSFHMKKITLHYQEKCRRQNCQFEHFNVNSEHFLEGGQSPPEMNVHNFPHLNPNKDYNRKQW